MPLAVSRGLPMKKGDKKEEFSTDGNHGLGEIEGPSNRP